MNNTKMMIAMLKMNDKRKMYRKITDDRWMNGDKTDREINGWI